MAGTDKKTKLADFLKTGIYKLTNSKAVFVDPVRMFNQNYTHFKISPSSYYPRFFSPKQHDGDHDEQQVVEEGVDQVNEGDECGVVKSSGKRKKNQRKSRNKKKRKKVCYALNEKELLADQRHKEIRGLLLKAHEELLGAKELLDVMCDLNCEVDGWEPCMDLKCREDKVEISFIELGKVWQAPLYEITLHSSEAAEQNEGNGDSSIIQHDNQSLLLLFNNLVSNETINDVVAEFLTSEYILPKESCFYLSDLGQIQNVVPADSDCGFNFILIDPPWENRSAYQKSTYPTLPNRYFLSIPIRQLTHTNGALVALWVTNREKLRNFVENELFPAWGVRYAATLYWLKVKSDASLICDLDLFHHRPYECLLLGYCGTEDVDSEHYSMKKSLVEDQVMITVPGDYSRKPPVGELLLEYVPGPRPTRHIELFAREMMAGWTSWGNEPLHFQESRYFSRQTGRCTN